MENEQKNESGGWPPSNYPIFLALVLLAATAVTLAMGDEPRAEELAIYAYYLLVIGVAIRFFELALPENTLMRLGVVRERFMGWTIGGIQRIRGIYRKIGSKLRLPEVRIPEVKVSNVHRAGFMNSLAFLCDVSKNVTVFLSLAFLILLIYGLMIDWWTVKGYFTNFVLVILGFIAMYFITKKLEGSLGEK